MNLLEIKKSIFSDTTEYYVNPCEVNEGDNVTIKLRVLMKAAKTVTLITDDKEYPMEKVIKNKNGFDYFEAKIDITSKTFSYFFRIECEEAIFVYDARGVVKKTSPEYYFKLIPGFKTPDWAKGGVFYQIYVDRFCNGDKSNDVVDGEYKYIDMLTEHREWDQPIGNGITAHYGGDLQGVIDKLDYLKDLGIEVIYLNPIFLSPSNHKYDIADYDYVDPHFGVIKVDEGEVLTDPSTSNAAATKFISRVTTMDNLEASNELFCKLTAAAHERGMKIILDGVFNHCGSFNKWMDAERIYENAEGYEKGAYIDKKSPYHDYFVWRSDGEWPYNNRYMSWWDFDTLPKLNYTTDELWKKILEIGAKWVSAPYNADGWRHDVAADLGPSEHSAHLFWADFRKKVKEANPDAIILGEHYGDPSSWLSGNQWDTVMNYDAFMEPVTWFLTGMEKHSDECRPELINDQNAFWKSMRTNGARFSNGSLYTAMNELSNHDHSRFLTRTNGKVGRVDALGEKAAETDVKKYLMREAVVMQMTWPGAPTVYYGDEAGMAGFTDPDNRRTYPWGKEDTDMLAFHKAAIAMHKESEALKKGSIIPLLSPTGVIAYGRVIEGEGVLTIINNNNINVELKLSTWMMGLGKNLKYETLLSTDREGFLTEEKRPRRDKNGILTITMKPNQAIVLNYTKNRKKKNA